MDYLFENLTTTAVPSIMNMSTSTSLTTPVYSSTVAPSEPDVMPQYVGFICAAVAVVMYASNAVPVKKFDTGDGMFFQWVCGSTIFLTGLILQIVRRSAFYPLIMAGGALWATGNVCVVAIIQCIGLSMGLCTWGMINLLTGWACGRLGLFGIKVVPLGHPVLNYTGVALATFSTLIYSQLRPNLNVPEMNLAVPVDAEASEPLLGPSFRSQGVSTNHPYYSEAPELIFSRHRENASLSFFERMTGLQRKLIGLGLSALSGVLYGFNFLPFIIVMQTVKGASQNSLDYIFAHYCGIYLASTVYFLVYCVAKRNKPQVNPSIILPGVAYGGLWSIGTMCWFVANATLSQSVSFPIICAGPAVFAALVWGIFVFREIKGLRNILLLLLAFCFTTSGSILAGVSLNGAANSTSHLTVFP